MMAAIIFSGLVILPLLFESYTFYLYTIAEPSFFTLSGARLWFFLAVELLLGFLMGRVIRLYWSAALITIATAVLITSLYNFCGDRQCYYAGPDGMGAIRLGILLFSTAGTGLVIGERTRKAENIPGKEPGTILFGALIVIFIGYFPMALLFGIFMPADTGIMVMVLASTLPFFFSGIVTFLFSGLTKRLGIISAIAGWAVLSALFGSLRPTSLPLLAVILAVGIPSMILGQMTAAWLVSRTRREISATIVFSFIVLSFVIGSIHPFLDAPMSMSIDRKDGLIATPTYYAGAYHQSDRYFATKRVEAEVNFEQLGNRGEFVLAGIGAQSPNCCKDGLDYGYRADILFLDSKVSLVARAWETCDTNIACSGFSWISTMHQQIVPLAADSLSGEILLAMEWQHDGRTVNWYFRNSVGNWTEYSSFLTPEIENPYFNLGVIDVGNPFSNPDTGKAFFYQAGVSRPDQTSFEDQAVTIKCPAYHDSQGARHCAEMNPIRAGNSHWKVLWKWGLQDQYSAVTIHGTDVIIGLE